MESVQMGLIKTAIFGYNKLKTVDALKKGMTGYTEGKLAIEAGKIAAKQGSKIIPLSEKRLTLLGK